MKWLIPPLLLFILSACGERVELQVIQSKIYGGELVGPKDWPSVVALTDKKNELVCSGVAINAKTILTAAHCFLPPNGPKKTASDLNIYMGKGSDYRLFGRHPISYYKIHSEYDPLLYDSSHDFALVYLTEKLPLKTNDFVKLLSEDELLETRQEIIIVGFGRRENGRSGKKSSTATYIWKIEDHEFYAGGGNRDSCHGDSGGPAFAQLEDGSMRLIGITSRPADSKHDCGFGTIFGNITSALPWFNKK